MAPPQASLRSGPRGAVAAAHPLAADAGCAVLAAGGSAVDAAIAAQAMICVVLPDAAGLGGDLLALVRLPGSGVTAVSGTGRSPARWQPERCTTGGTSVTVPGLVAGWAGAHTRWGRLPLAQVLAPAVTAAREGLALDPGLATAVSEQRARLRTGGAQDWPLLHLSAGERWVQPELADLLEAIGVQGRSAFYSGRIAQAVCRAVAAAGGALHPQDLARHRTLIGSAIDVRWGDDVVHVQPPPSQGVLLAMALSYLQQQADVPDSHLLVELIAAVFTHRAESGVGARLLTTPLTVDRERASLRGGPRGYLHTAGVAVADADGCVVSSLISVFDNFGSGVFVPEGGFVLNNRAAGFTDGPNAPAAGRRPVHTLAPALLERPDGSALALATPGADGQIQTLLQLLSALRAGVPLTDAVTAPRWRSEDGRLLLEPDHPDRNALAGAGHRISTDQAGAEIFGAVVAAGAPAGVMTGTADPFAVADWRRTTAAAAASRQETA